MIDIVKLYHTVNDQMSQNNGRYIEMDGEFDRIVNIVQDNYFRELIGKTNAKVDGRTRVSYGTNQEADSRLNPFKVKIEVSVNDGEAIIPSNSKIEKITSITNKYTRRALKRLDEDREGSIFGNPLREPNEDDIYYLEAGNNTLEVFGITDKIIIRYLRLPERAKLATKQETITAGSRTVTRTVPDPSNSVNLEWGETEYKTILNRVIDMFSTPNKDVFLTQKMERSKVSE